MTTMDERLPPDGQSVRSLMARLISSLLTRILLGLRGRRPGWPRTRAGLLLLEFAHRWTPQLPAECYTAPGDTVAYAGFYRPEYALALAAQLGEECELVLLEAHPDNHRRLVDGLGEGPLARRIHALHLALWSRSGTIPLDDFEEDAQPEFNRISAAVGEPHYGRSAAKLVVPCDTLDSVLVRFPRLRHVFVTVNGAELEALAGMERYLATPGVTAWIKSPFRNTVTRRRMCEEVVEALRGSGCRATIARDPQRSPDQVMGKVFAYRPLA